jgi:penicillin-binding protein 1B
MLVGLDSVIDLAKRLGIESKITPLPSLTLGAFEIRPVEVLQAYSAFANLGRKVPLTLLERVEGLEGNILYQNTPQPIIAVAPEPVAALVGMMKQTLLTGTGRGARAAGFIHPAAGKTGTTNDKKDAWFAGFTPLHAAVVWVGYDDNTPHGMTGGSGAVPIWANYMNSYASALPPIDFPWPESVERVTLSVDQQLAAGVPAKEPEKLEPIELILKKP